MDGILDRQPQPREIHMLLLHTLRMWIGCACTPIKWIGKLRSIYNFDFSTVALVNKPKSLGSAGVLCAGCAPVVIEALTPEAPKEWRLLVDQLRIAQVHVIQTSILIGFHLGHRVHGSSENDGDMGVSEGMGLPQIIQN